MTFAERHSISPMVKATPLAKAPQSYDRMMAHFARFHIVLTIGSLSRPYTPSFVRPIPGRARIDHFERWVVAAH